MLNKRCKSYSFSEYRKINQSSYSLLETILEHIKANKLMYLRLVFFTALLLNYDILIYANSFGSSLDRVGNQILTMLMSVAK